MGADTFSQKFRQKQRETDATNNNVFCNKFVTMWWRRGILNNDIPPGHVGDRGGGGGGDQHVNPGSQ